ncbi:MAG: SEC-C metal-binding domain-containing protein [Planctomycetes bacterium]|nr:SEC-C metal-binding domain-containing protein [Planctomycetota bacterium]
MNGEFSQLPWNELRRTDATIPWPALRTFAAAVVTDSRLTPELFEVYDLAYEAEYDQPRYTDFYVAAIFTLAAPRLDDERRREIGSLLIERMVRAGEDDADVSLEVLLAAAGTMGPPIVSAVLDAIDSEPDTRGAWVFLWDLTKLAAQSEDEALRSRVIQACVDLLEKVERNEADPGDGMDAAWTLAAFQRPEHGDLLRRLSEKPMERWWIADYRAALQLWQGRSEPAPPPELWEEPVEEWLPPRCKMVRDWFEKKTKPWELPEEGPEAERARDLAIGFLLSPVARTLPAGLRDEAYTIVYGLLYHSLTRLDKEPGEWDEFALRQLLLQTMPEQTPADRALLEKIAPVTEALLYWLGFEGLLADADALIASVRGLSEDIVAIGMDPQRWGPVKRALMEAKPTSVNVVEEETVAASAAEQTAESLPPQPPDGPTPKAEEPPLPIAEYAAKVGRNDPCPCGSGRKYKKCHGRPGAEEMTVK